MRAELGLVSNPHSEKATVTVGLPCPGNPAQVVLRARASFCDPAVGEDACRVGVSEQGQQEHSAAPGETGRWASG